MRSRHFFDLILLEAVWEGVVFIRPYGWAGLRPNSPRSDLDADCSTDLASYPDVAGPVQRTARQLETT